jgi:hypothetical protein
MGQILGSKSALILDFETTYKTDPASPVGLLMPYNKFNMVGKVEKKQRNTIRGDRNAPKPYNGNMTVTGSAEVPVDYQAFAYWLKAMFGAPATTGSGPYVHTYKVADAMPSFLTELKYADNSAVLQYAKRNGCKIGSWGMTVNSDGSELVSTFDIIGATETFSATAYDATPTTFTDDAFQNVHVTLEEGGSSTTVSSLDFKIDFGLTGDKFVVGDGSNSIVSLPEGMVQVSGNLSAIFEDMALLNKAINDTESSIVITMTNGTNILEIAFNELLFERNSPGIDGPQGVDITLPFFAFMDDDAAASIATVTLTNSVESYA